MTFKDDDTREKFKKFYRQHAAEKFILFSLIFSLAEEMEQSKEKNFDKLTEIFFKRSDKLYGSNSAILSQLDKILDVLRNYWAFGNIIPEK